ncbi:tetratricopeptide repeat protein [Lysobacter sp. A3-1-A15]|uniref:tetratricopeptide repeat protein n=1 Tax=Novilysobacter viscosus TaxID=3098602 RepID=UPI002EDBA59F
MTQASSRYRTLLASAIGAALLLGSVTQVHAQSAADRVKQERERRAAEAAENKQDVAAETYPNAKRQPSKVKASARMSPKLQKMVDLYDEDKGAEARAAAEEIIASERSNEYDRAFAAQLAAQAAYDADDMAGAMAYLQQAIDFDGLDNNGHFGAMLMLAQLQLQEEMYAESLKTLDTFLDLSASSQPEHLVLKGNALYRMERYPEAVQILKQAVDSSPDPRADWLQLLMAVYSETGQEAEASAIAEKIGSQNPNDKRAQLNLAAAYQQADQMDKAAGVLEKLRAAGQLSEDREYRQLYALYLNLEGKEKNAAEVINEGLQKGILKGDFQTYLAQAQAYYFSDQTAPAIEAYRKAAPLDDNGATYLNLAKVLWQEERITEAKEAARQAKAKGLERPDEADQIIALPGN